MCLTGRRYLSKGKKKKKKYQSQVFSSVLYLHAAMPKETKF